MSAALESHFQAQFKDALALAGFKVYHTSAFKQKGGSGVDRGVPDLLVVIPGLWCYLGLEVKRPGTVRWSSPEQQAAYESGHFALVQSLDDALTALVRLKNRIPASNEFCDQIKRFEKIAGQVPRG